MYLLCKCQEPMVFTCLNHCGILDSWDGVNTLGLAQGQCRVVHSTNNALCQRTRFWGAAKRSVLLGYHIQAVVNTIYEKEVSDAIATQMIHNAEHGRLIKDNLPQRHLIFG